MWQCTTIDDQQNGTTLALLRPKLRNTPQSADTPQKMD